MLRSALWRVVASARLTSHYAFRPCCTKEPTLSSPPFRYYALLGVHVLLSPVLILRYCRVYMLSRSALVLRYCRAYLLSPLLWRCAILPDMSFLVPGYCGYRETLRWLSTDTRKHYGGPAWAWMRLYTDGRSGMDWRGIGSGWINRSRAGQELQGCRIRAFGEAGRNQEGGRC